MLREYVFLIPETRGDNGLLHKGAVFSELNRALFKLAGGFTEGPLVNGCWRNAEGTSVLDRSTPYIVATVDEPAIVEIVRRACNDFGQSCIYFRYPDGSVALLKPYAVTKVEEVNTMTPSSSYHNPKPVQVQKLNLPAKDHRIRGFTTSTQENR